MLHPFHVSKRTISTDAMLLRVYGPILWRSLRCANGIVRCQAAALFFDCFPLKNDESTAAEIDEILQKQFELFNTLLKDDDHRVRCVSVTGVCGVLHTYWEVLPSPVKHSVLTLLVGTLALDGSCAAVRMAVVNGLAHLLDQPLAHTTLKKMIPLLAQCIHDNSEAVRVAFVHLLCRVKNTKGVSFYEIVPVEHLLYRLCEDKHRPSMCYAMAELLSDSLVPAENSVDQSTNVESEYIQRCLRLISSHPIAAECVYAHLHRSLSLKQIVSLAALLFSFACTFSVDDAEENVATNANVSKGKNSKGGKRSKQTVEKSDDRFNNDSVLTPETRLSVFQVVLALLQSIHGKLTTKSVKAQHIKLLKTCCCDSSSTVMISDQLRERAVDDSIALEILLVMQRVHHFCSSLGEKDVSSQPRLTGGAKILLNYFADFHVKAPACAKVSKKGASQIASTKQMLTESLVVTVFAMDQQQILIDSIAASLQKAATKQNAMPVKRRRDTDAASASVVTAPVILAFETAVDLLAAIVEFDRANSAFAPSSSAASVNSLMNWTQCEALLRPLQQLLLDVLDSNFLVNKQHTMSSEDLQSSAAQRNVALRCAHILTSIHTITELHNSLTQSAAVTNGANDQDKDRVGPLLFTVTQQLMICTDKLHSIELDAISDNEKTFFSEMSVDLVKLVSVVMSVFVDAMKIKLDINKYSDTLANLERFANGLLLFLSKFSEMGSSLSVLSASVFDRLTGLASILASMSTLLAQKSDNQSDATVPEFRVGLFLLNCLRPLVKILNSRTNQGSDGSASESSAVADLNSVRQWPKSVQSSIEKSIALLEKNASGSDVQDNHGSSSIRHDVPESCVDVAGLRQTLLLQC
jgi:hypothetical protein